MSPAGTTRTWPDVRCVSAIERKADLKQVAWESVPLRPVLKKYEQQRVEFVNEKAREAAQVRTQAAQDVERANAVIVQAAQWWRQTGPALQQAFASKWASVDWKALAEKDPAEYARLDQERQNRGIGATDFIGAVVAIACTACTRAPLHAVYKNYLAARSAASAHVSSLTFLSNVVACICRAPPRQDRHHARSPRYSPAAPSLEDTRGRV
jgi:hypothetical protein